MNKNKYLQTLALAFSCMAAGGASAAPVILKLSHTLPAVAPAHVKFVVPWCEKIEAESKGELKCQIYPAMQLGGTPAHLFNQARDGVADISWTLPGYTPGRFPISEVFELPFITTDSSLSSRALWDFIQENASNEFKGVKLLAAWVNGPNQLHLRDRKVEKLEDMRGLKIRAPSRLGNKILAALGATPVGMPVPQMAESLAKGVIDGALVAWEVVPSTKAHELTKYHLEVSGNHAMTTATFVMVMNPRSYERLSPEQKQVIDANSGPETSAWIASVYAEADKAGRAAAIAQGNEVYTLSPEQTALWEQAAQPVTENWIKEVSAKGADGEALVRRARELVQQYSARN